MRDIGADAFPVRRQGSGTIRANPGLQVVRKRPRTAYDRLWRREPEEIAAG